MVDPIFWKNKKVLVTGHTGFKGSWLALWLQILGAEVVGLALKPDEDQKLFSLLKLNESMEKYFIDIRDRKSEAEAIAELNSDVVIHMAAQPLVRYSYELPIETYETKVLGTAHVLQAIRQCDRTKVIVSFATARAGNIIGGGDWSKDRLIPYAIQAWKNNAELEIRNAASTRPWQHVLESLSGYLCLADRSCGKMVMCFHRGGILDHCQKMLNLWGGLLIRWLQ